MFCQRVMIVYYIFLSFMFLCVSCGELSTDPVASLDKENKESKTAQPSVAINNPSLPSNNLEGASEGNLNSHPPAASVDSPTGTSLLEPPALSNHSGTVLSPNGAILPSSSGTTNAPVDSTSHPSPVDSTTTEASKEHQSPANVTSSAAPSVTSTTAAHSDPSTTQNPPKGSAGISSAALSLIILGSTIASIL